MSSLESRVKALEDQTAAPWQGHRPGVRTVKFESLDWRKTGMMKYDRFVLLELKRRDRHSLLNAVLDGKPYFAPPTEKEKEMDAVGERLRREFLDHPEWSREEKNEKAKRQGFRVIYPDSPDGEAIAF